MIWLLSALKFIRQNAMAFIIAAFSAFALSQKMRADRLVKKNEKLEVENETLHINKEALELRNRPVPDDKHSVLERM